MDFHDVIKAATLTDPLDRLRVTGAPGQLPVAYTGANGIEVGAYSLDILYVTGNDTLVLSTYVGRWQVVDPVQDYRGRLTDLPGITNVYIEWGDGQTNNEDMPRDQFVQTTHEYPYPADWLITATVTYRLDSIPTHLATLYPTATYLFRARNPTVDQAG